MDDGHALEAEVLIERNPVIFAAQANVFQVLQPLEQVHDFRADSLAAHNLPENP